jgi:hypothetical protein
MGGVEDIVAKVFATGAEHVHAAGVMGVGKSHMPAAAAAVVAAPDSVVVVGADAAPMKRLLGAQQLRCVAGYSLA